MAVIVLTESGEGIEAEISSDGNTFTRVFKVEVDDILTASLDAVNASGLPLIGDPLDGDETVRCSRRRLRQTESRLHFVIFVEYDKIGTGEEEDPNPLNREADITWSGTEEQSPVVRDAVDKTPIENSTGDQFDPLPEEDFSIPTVTIQRNEAIFNPLLAINFRNKVNSVAFSVAGLLVPEEAQAKLKQFDATNEVENDFVFQRVTYKLEFKIGEEDEKGKQLGHDRLLLDQGLHVFDDNFNKIRIRLGDGTETDKPLKLNGQGKELDRGLKAVYIRFATAKRIDFTTLNLPATLSF